VRILAHEFDEVPEAEEVHGGTICVTGSDRSM
jgi:hypothetical protein